MTPNAKYLEQLRAWRTRKNTPSIGLQIQSLGREITRKRRQVGSIGEVWARLVPVESHVISFRGGILTVGVPDASAQFALDRWLRSGGNVRIEREARAPLKRIRIMPHQPRSDERA
ncbi:MAG: hypothetical protein KDA28_05540 [Phycisphaerales bacterium]|nr:hypothetical protein [Phycisphaerales bacterium]